MEDTKYSKIVRVLKSDILAGKYAMRGLSPVGFHAESEGVA